MSYTNLSNIPTYTVCLPNGELNEHSVCKPSGYHQLICAAAEADLAHCGNSINDTIGKGYAWAIISLTIDVKRPLDHCEPLTMRTWIAPAHSPFSRREVSAADRSGNVVFNTSIYMVPLDVNTHKILRNNFFDSTVYENDQFVTGEPLIDNVRTRMSEPDGFVHLCDRTIMPSDIDALGHMNNCRYGAFAYDALDRQQRELFSRPFVYTIDYRRQLTEGESVSIDKLTDGCSIYVRGINSDGKLSFLARFSNP